MSLGNISPLIYVYNGDPTGVSTSIIDVPKGSLVLDTATPAVWQKTSAQGSNAGYEQIIIGAGGITIKVTVANQAARFALTTANVQNGDFVLQSDTNVLYEVVDQTALNSEAGYSAIKNLPISAVVGLQAALDAKADVATVISDVNSEKYLLVDPPVGQLFVVTDQGNRLEMFTGDASDDTKCGVILADMPDFVGSGPWALVPQGSNIWVESPDVYSWAIAGGSGAWQINNGVNGENIWTSDEAVDFPWEVTAWDQGESWSGETYPNQPTITRAPSANDDNWTVLRNTINLFVEYGASGDELAVAPEINGVELIYGTPGVDCGWVDPQNIPAVFDGTFNVARFNNIGPDEISVPFGAGNFSAPSLAFPFRFNDRGEVSAEFTFTAPEE